MIKVLIVEDEEIIRKGIKHSVLWEEYSCAVIGEACNGEEGKEMIETLHPDIVVTDINMPVMNGVEFLKALRAKSEANAIPVLIISTEGSKLRYEELEELGVQGILRKPVRPEVLTDTVNHLLGGS